eukprot:TRINITY_DN80989_c0_g1_i1.p1 TRINITY_DN80989_c0_g1~~TRINITY_DN80989_c0_g1_i1.p1  ORF type:complete len:631 (-),score=80.81 TRINITY_DN80989_c0_g1_i1:41-1933(-)
MSQAKYVVSGLANLGNTCFMNSALQCLVNTPGLYDHFMADEYKRNINTANRFGTKGQLSHAFAQLMEELTEHTKPTVNPVRFRDVLIRFAPRFAGFAQHDAQEFLAYLLDGLHEDLNNAAGRAPPPVAGEPTNLSQAETNKRDDDASAGCVAWHQHLLRNDSVIVQLFQGQLRSRIRCDQCAYVSTSFDPFMYLSLPLPTRARDAVSTGMVIVVPDANPCGAAHIVKYHLPGPAVVADLARALRKYYRWSGTSSVVVRQFHPTLNSLGEPRNGTDLLTGNVANTLTLVFHIDEPAVTSAPEPVMPVVVLLPKIANLRMHFPRMIAVAHPCSVANLYHAVAKHLPLQATTSAQAEPYPFTLSTAASQGQPSVLEQYSEELLAPAKELELHLQWADDSDSRIVAAPAMESRSISETAPVNLADCLASFTAEEQLGEQERWHCPQCKEPRRAFKKFDLWRMPRYLVVHLKRFAATGLVKNSSPVSFPAAGMAEFSPFVWSEASHNLEVSVDRCPACASIGGAPAALTGQYELYAAALHFGTLGNGHYTAKCRLPHSQHWYSYDDAVASPLRGYGGEPDTDAYLLFYEWSEEIERCLSTKGASCQPAAYTQNNMQAPSGQRTASPSGSLAPTGC